jgi:hypothetical protein
MLNNIHNADQTIMFKNISANEIQGKCLYKQQKQFSSVIIVD